MALGGTEEPAALTSGYTPRTGPMFTRTLGRPKESR
jgi:hypothetical protein